MRTILAYLVVTFCFTLKAQTDKSIIALYNFDNCLTNDVIGNGNVSQVNGAPECVCGVKDKGLRFDGIDDEIFFLGNISDNFQNADFSLSFYFKPSVQLGNQVIFSKREDCNETKVFSVNFNLASNTLTVLIAESAIDKVTLTKKLLKSDCWQHIVITRRNRTHQLYVNGKLADDQESTKRLKIGNNDPFSIAKGPCTNQIKFKGDLDEIIVYNRAIDADKIQELYLKPDHIANFDTLIYLGGSVPIKTTQTCASSFSWNPSSGVSDPFLANAILSPSITTTYRLDFNIDGCIASDTIRIKVVDPDKVPCDLVYLPKAFTPNGDGLNDQFGISNPFVVKSIKTFDIFDSWGGKMFTTTDVFKRWDGLYNGTPVSPGVYLYKVVFECKGEERIQQGSVVVLK